MHITFELLAYRLLHMAPTEKHIIKAKLIIAQSSGGKWRKQRQHPKVRRMCLKKKTGSHPLYSESSHSFLQLDSTSTSILDGPGPNSIICQTNCWQSLKARHIANKLSDLTKARMTLSWLEAWLSQIRATKSLKLFLSNLRTLHTVQTTFQVYKEWSRTVSQCKILTSLAFHPHNSFLH